MSRVFSDTDSLEGLVQMFEEEIEADPGFVSSTPKRLKRFVSATRTAWDKYMHLAFKSSSTWQYDDSNHTDYPIIKTNIVSGQRDYTFTTDEGNNLILDIYKVAILPSATETLYEEIKPVDQQERDPAQQTVYDLVAENATTGVPFQYDKTANGIFLDPIPGYNATNGLKVYINREANYFTTSDTTKKPGCPGIHHDYFFLRPALDYARKHNLANYNKLLDEVISYEGDEEKGIVGSIERYFSRRSRDEEYQITPQQTNYR